MRVIETKSYSLHELSEQVQQTAFEIFCNNEREYFWIEESLNSLKKGLEHFGFNLEDYDFDYHHATNGYLSIKYKNSNGWHDEEDTLKGIRLWKFINNNMLTYWDNFNDKYQRGNLLNGNCPFSGYCSDEDFLDPIRNFMKNPVSETTFLELMEDCTHSVMTQIEKDYEYQNSIEYFKEECEANELEFTKNGLLI